MKTKKILKKLRLNKKTVANIDNRVMKEVKGGGETDVGCGTENVICLSLVPRCMGSRAGGCDGETFGDTCQGGCYPTGPTCAA
jgi:natural product precursor